METIEIDKLNEIIELLTKISKQLEVAGYIVK